MIEFAFFVHMTKFLAKAMTVLYAAQALEDLEKPQNTAECSEKGSGKAFLSLFCQLRLRRGCGMIKFQKSDHLKRKGCGSFL